MKIEPRHFMRVRRTAFIPEVTNVRNAMQKEQRGSEKKYRL
jgi:hypothetical protein